MKNAASKAAASFSSTSAGTLPAYLVSILSSLCLLLVVQLTLISGTFKGQAKGSRQPHRDGRDGRAAEENPRLSTTQNPV
jgi:hypothetical protein